MRKNAVTTTVVAAAVIGGVVACGGNGQREPPLAPKPAATSQSVRRTCEQHREQIRKKHPNAVIGGCNYGAGTLTAP